ncbi:MAG: exosome complex protein Rrp42 [Candidatus Nanoarchaeia archaeon]|jgi:exosome complex component RRP42|nr:exosome complex protein Rrp42 [Candidatus Nanoarchaeia archaeon]|tara:strand:- start:3168 stop:3950 length:783 start_codon:yes stop_codon:yes gene_type:complete
MTLINYDFQKELISKGKREDGRGLNDYRDFSAEVGIIENGNGSARVKLGDTEIIAGVKFSVGTPYPDSPDEGMFMVSMDLNPLSSPDFEPGPPKPAAIEISRVVDRAIRESKTLDFKDLSIVHGETAWMCSIDIYPINADGNLYDAAVIAAYLALKDAKFPELDEDNKPLHETRTKKGLKLHNIPMMVSFAKIGDSLIVDPTRREEQIMEDRIHIGTIDNGNICAMQKGGLKPLTNEELLEAVDTAIAKGKDLRKLLKKL